MAPTDEAPESPEPPEPPEPPVGPDDAVAEARAALEDIARRLAEAESALIALAEERAAGPEPGRDKSAQLRFSGPFYEPRPDEASSS